MNKNELHIEKVRSIIREVANLKEQDKKLKKIKGEDFNLFSIMRMEYNENKTHSNIIGELLNPLGSHHMGNVFLKEFLMIIYCERTDTNGKLKETPDVDLLLEQTSPKISIEHHIGIRNNKKKTGGRIDLLIEFGNQHTITIENKINAADQFLQLKRYHNFRKGKNDVFYLTKSGSMASQKSLDDLTEDDICCISYEEHIKEWIQSCIRISAEEPILRESLKQYLILIKKITFQMEDQLENEMNELLKNNLRTASTIFNGYLVAKNLIKNEIKNEVFNKLKPLVADYNLKIIHGGDIKHKFSQIWVDTKGIENPAVRFGIESFSGHDNSWNNGQLMVGIFNNTRNETIAKEINEECESTFFWPYRLPLKDSNMKPLKLDNLDTLDLYLDTTTRQQNIDIIVNAALKMIKDKYELVNKINIRQSHV